MHSTDRYIMVISGTWWMGTGAKYEPESMVPVSAGTYVVHHANEIHYDGAKDEEVIVQIAGYGPSGTTEIFPAEARFGVPHKLK